MKTILILEDNDERMTEKDSIKTRSLMFSVSALRSLCSFAANPVSP